MTIKTPCPICDGTVVLADGTEESEIITCTECNNQLVVETIKDKSVTLSEAPEMEEDWGQ